jgi:hypothetical protein
MYRPTQIPSVRALMIVALIKVLMKVRCVVNPVHTRSGCITPPVQILLFKY